MMMTMGIDPRDIAAGLSPKNAIGGRLKPNYLLLSGPSPGRTGQRVTQVFRSQVCSRRSGQRPYLDVFHALPKQGAGDFAGCRTGGHHVIHYGYMG